MTISFGIDIGGSGIKGAPVDLKKGKFAAKRLRIPTPQPSTPQACGEVIAAIVEHFADEVPAGSPVGITIPGPVQHGTVPFMANLSQEWVNFPANDYFEDRLGRPVSLFNDADAAGLAEVKYGAAKKHPGLVIVTTLGTGIGTALIHNGVLIPNSELGHLEIDGYDAEKRAASSIKENEGLTYPEWAERLQRYYSHVEMLLSPDLFVVGGGISKDWEQFGPLLRLKTPIVPAQLLNKAGIIGAAIAAEEAVKHPDQLAHKG
ncbi:polyphosphate--glucose phosphotransferase [Tessaracoccus caeni]|uniref:polyphosphate--glucose phosphotransferase n=1 Tax=Tessaracoccus caeni TaxID=3031239 RepID=UPI0023DCCD40|nr:ROK family protein [Tessaracoccus caeni]MDF1487528.1 ROK family protein [Tessaracoccus caeni]